MKSLENKKALYAAAVIIIIGAFLRIIGLSDIPCGLNQDEAFAGYEAFSLLNFGTDSSGYPFPCYFVSWGSGMNVLESYLAIPFVALLGNTALSIRLPMLIISLLSLPVFYSLLKTIFNQKTALIGLCAISFCPWHIMLSRFGLESNLAPSFLLFGLYFLIKGLKNSIWWLLSAVMYGISLYAYSITWIVVPFTLVAFFIYLIICKQKLNVKNLIISGVILFIFALPFILFMLVNMNVIGEIKTAVFSVPKLIAMRSGEISLHNLLNAERYYDVIKLVLGGSDNLIWNSTNQFGMYYLFSIPFIIIGIVVLARHFSKNAHQENLILIGFVCSFIAAVTVSGININKANHLHIYTLIMLSVGISAAINFFKHKRRIFAVLLCVLYATGIVSFTVYYFKDYNQDIAHHFNSGVEECVDTVNRENAKSVAVDSRIYHSQILYFDRTPTDVYINTVKFSNYPSPYLKASKFGKYEFKIDYNSIGSFDAYIVPSDKVPLFTQKGYRTEIYGEFAVAVK